MVRVLFIEAMPIWFQIRPKSARSMRASASSQISPSPWTRDCGIEGQGPDTVARGQRAGHGDTLTRRPDTVRGEGDVRMVAAVEEVTRAQVCITPSVLRVDGRRGHRDGATDLAVRRHGAVPADLAEDTVDMSQTPHASALQPYAGSARVQNPFPGRAPSFSRACTAGAVICPTVPA